MNKFERGKEPKAVMGAGIEADMFAWLAKEYNQNYTGEDINVMLRICADEGKLDYVRYLVEVKNADIQSSDNAAVRWAASNGQLDVVKYLIEKGANPFAANGWALKRAREEGHWDVVEYLEEAMKEDYISRGYLPVKEALL